MNDISKRTMNSIEDENIILIWESILPDYFSDAWANKDVRDSTTCKELDLYCAGEIPDFPKF